MDYDDRYGRNEGRYGSYREGGSSRYGTRSRYDNDRNYGDRNYGRGNYGRDDDRGFFNRAGDEVASWFGDDEAERRRRMDERRDPDTWHLSGDDDDRGRHGRSTSRYGRDNDDDYSYRRSRGGYSSPYASGSETRGMTTSGNYDDYYDNDRSSRRMTGYGTSAGMGAAGYGYGRSTYGGSSYDNDRNDDNDWGRQSHRGKGPKNYSRSPDRIKEDVSQHLQDDHDLDASDIEVKAEKNGEVTLTGQVDDRWQKRHAEECAYKSSGVNHVQNNLRFRDNDNDVKNFDDEATNENTAKRRKTA